MWFKNRRVKWRKGICDWGSSRQKRLAAHTNCLYDSSEKREAFPPYDLDQAISLKHGMALGAHTQSPAVAPHASLFESSGMSTVFGKNASMMPDAFYNGTSLTQNITRSLRDTSVLNGTRCSYAGNSSAQNCSLLTRQSKSTNSLYGDSNALQWCASSGDNVMGDRNVMCNPIKTRDAGVINGSSWMPFKNPTVQMQLCTHQTRSLSCGHSNDAVDGNGWLSGETSSLSQTFDNFSNPSEVSALLHGASTMPHSATMNAFTKHDANLTNENRWLSCANASFSQNRTQFQGSRKVHCAGAFHEADWVREPHPVMHASWTQAVPELKGGFIPANSGDQIVPECSREQMKAPEMTQPSTTTSCPSADYLQPTEMRLRDVDKSSVLDDLMEIISEEELPKLWS